MDTRVQQKIGSQYHYRVASVKVMT